MLQREGGEGDRKERERENMREYVNGGMFSTVLADQEGEVQRAQNQIVWL